jgi:mannose-6-phosphate isomerase-like protein (cupin superfamily)
MWLGGECIVVVGPGASFAITSGTPFQLRNTGTDPVECVAVTMPPWPGEDEAEIVSGPWIARLETPADDPD